MKRTGLVFQGNECENLTKSLKLNRLLYISLGLNHLLFTLFYFKTKAFCPFFILSSAWVIIIFYFLFSEILLLIVKNTYLSSEKLCDRLVNFNILLTFVYLLGITFFTNSNNFIFLMIIPVFQAKLTRKNYYAVVILILSAVLSAWGIIFKGQPAFTENLPDILKGSSFLSILFVLGYLGWTIAGIINKINHKALFMHNMATTDALTGLINRREFNRRISEEFSRAKRHKLNLCVALFDIDFFKKINDSYGHNAGDAILKELGKLISSNTRSCDIAARYGGEEFALILPETSQTDAYELMDRLRSLVEKEIFYKKIKPIKATVSVGVAQMESNDKNPLEFCERADKALYKAKNKGRNRVEKAFSEIMTLNVRSKAV